MATQNTKTLKRREVAERLGMSLSWLDQARLKGFGPDFVRIGRSIRYPVDAIERFEAETLVKLN